MKKYNLLTISLLACHVLLPSEALLKKKAVSYAPLESLDQEHLDRIFGCACKEGALDLAHKSLRKGASAPFCDPVAQTTPLHFAPYFAHLHERLPSEGGFFHSIKEFFSPEQNSTTIFPRIKEGIDTAQLEYNFNIQG